MCSWVADVSGEKRIFLRGTPSARNRRHIVYELEPGHVYDIHRRYSWNEAEQYLAKIQDGKLVKLSCCSSR
jgi:hypothetical protein